MVKKYFCIIFHLGNNVYIAASSWSDYTKKNGWPYPFNLDDAVVLGQVESIDKVEEQVVVYFPVFDLKIEDDYAYYNKYCKGFDSVPANCIEINEDRYVQFEQPDAKQAKDVVLNETQEIFVKAVAWQRSTYYSDWPYAYACPIERAYFHAVVTEKKKDKFRLLFDAFEMPHNRPFTKTWMQNFVVEQLPSDAVLISKTMYDREESITALKKRVNDEATDDKVTAKRRRQL